MIKTSVKSGLPAYGGMIKRMGENIHGLGT